MILEMMQHLFKKFRLLCLHMFLNLFLLLFASNPKRNELPDKERFGV